MKRKLKIWIAFIFTVAAMFCGMYVYEGLGYMDQRFSANVGNLFESDGQDASWFHLPDGRRLGKGLKDFIAGVADNGEAAFYRAMDSVPDIGPRSVGKGNASADGVMKIHFIDVGQGDAILLQQGDACMLVDAGDNDKGTLVCQYLEAAGVEHLAYICVTHPDADHCGGVDDVLRTYGKTNMLMAQCTNDTATYDEMIQAIDDTDSFVEYPSSGDTYHLGDADIAVLCPEKNAVGAYGDTNDYSIGILVEYGDISCVMCGDASERVERDIVYSGIGVEADILKLGHHGSDTSSCDIFLDAVSPDYAVISAGRDSVYGHPHKEVMQRMQERNISIFRTDMQGTVVAITDGKNLEWNLPVCQDYICGSDLVRDDVGK